MNRRWYLYGVLAVAAVTVVACVRAPRMHYANQRVANLKDTAELMRVLYKTLSPVWDDVKAPHLSAADFATMAAAAPRVEAVSSALTSRPVASRYPGGFITPARSLGQHGAALRAAAANRKEAAARAAVKGINAACSACHAEYR